MQGIRQIVKQSVCGDYVHIKDIFWERSNAAARHYGLLTIRISTRIEIFQQIDGLACEETSWDFIGFDSRILCIPCIDQMYELSACNTDSLLHSTVPAYSIRHGGEMFLPIWYSKICYIKCANIQAILFRSLSLDLLTQNKSRSP